MQTPESALYFPHPYPAGYWTPSEYGFSVQPQDCYFQAIDGTQLHGWWIPASADAATPVLLFCHGNAGNLTYRLDNLEKLQQVGISTFIFDYRGYGRSQGQPSEAGLYQDGRAAYDFITGELAVAPKQLVAFGRSLGGAIAIELAVDPQYPLAGLIVESSFTSLSDLAAIFFPQLPPQRLSGQYESLAKISQIPVPLLLVHGQRDELIPFTQAQQLYEAAPEPKTLYVVPEGMHNDTYLVGGAGYLDQIRRFCRDVIQEG